jgi:hypothetical protein
MPTPARVARMADDIRDAVHALKAPPCRLSMTGTAALRRLESIAQSLEDAAAFNTEVFAAVDAPAPLERAG